MVLLLELPNELLLLISTNLKSEADLSHLLQVNYRLYDLLLPDLYQQNEECWKSQGLFKCAAKGNERDMRHFLYWGASVDVQSMPVQKPEPIRRFQFRLPGPLPPFLGLLASPQLAYHLNLHLSSKERHP